MIDGVQRQQSGRVPETEGQNELQAATPSMPQQTPSQTHQTGEQEQCTDAAAAGGQHLSMLRAEPSYETACT